MLEYLSERKVLVTGHTGFKGSWLCKILSMHGAHVYGFSNANYENSKLYNILRITDLCDNECFADIRDIVALNTFISNVKPDIVFHMAAQPLVRKSYRVPKDTFEVNAIGTLNILECLKDYGKPCQVVCITTDKVYQNGEKGIPFKEDDSLGGYDPYSASKAAAEIIVDSYRKSFFNPNSYGKMHQIQLASARAGNVIGGGDFSEDRIIPDIVRSIESGQILEIRSPKAIRPWQHVLEPLFGYIQLACKMCEGFREEYCSAFNFGPNDTSFKEVKYIVERGLEILGKGEWKDVSGQKNLHEAGILKLNNSKAKNLLEWQPKIELDRTLDMTFEWYRQYLNTKDYRKLTDIIERQIHEYSK